MGTTTAPDGVEEYLAALAEFLGYDRARRLQALSPYTT
jgi:hypothetical protein